MKKNGIALKKASKKKLKKNNKKRDGTDMLKEMVAAMGIK